MTETKTTQEALDPLGRLPENIKELGRAYLRFGFWKLPWKTLSAFIETPEVFNHTPETNADWLLEKDFRKGCRSMVELLGVAEKADEFVHGGWLLRIPLNFWWGEAEPDDSMIPTQAQDSENMEAALRRAYKANADKVALAKSFVKSYFGQVAYAIEEQFAKRPDEAGELGRRAARAFRLVPDSENMEAALEAAFAKADEAAEAWGTQAKQGAEAGEAAGGATEATETPEGGARAVLDVKADTITTIANDVGFLVEREKERHANAVNQGRENAQWQNDADADRKKRLLNSFEEVFKGAKHGDLKIEAANRAPALDTTPENWLRRYYDWRVKTGKIKPKNKKRKGNKKKP